MEEDVENYIRYKLIGGKIHLKEHVVPHIFDCQINRKRSSTVCERSGSIKRSRKSLIDTLLDSDDNTFTTCTESPTVEVHNEAEAVSSVQDNVEVISNVEVRPSFSSEMSTQTLFTIQRTVSTQYKPHYRSKFIQTEGDLIATKTVSTASSPFKSAKLNYLLSPSKYSEIDSNSDFNITSESDTAFAYVSGNESSSSIMQSKDQESKRIKAISIERSKYLAVNKCRFYLGIPEDSYIVVPLLQRYTCCSLTDIYVTLKKIKVNLPFSYIGDDFGISGSQAAKIFNKTLPRLSSFLKTFIYWPPKDKIKLLLPIPFRANYYDVESIIDCFEVEIEKPSDPIKQASTWSEYKKTNTMKYLISSTPDGLINFVSNGFGGRITDAAIVKHSEYLKILKKDCAVMADRGFKRIDVLLQPLGCKLIRPPSVKAGVKCTKEEVLETKRIAALRIHIERVIRRVREFKILKPHSCINKKTIKYLDHIVLIVCALINLQSSLIKK